MRDKQRWLALSVTLAAWILCDTFTWAGEVFRCPDEKGGFVLRDVPCSLAPPSTGESGAPAASAGAAPGKPQKPPTSARRTTSTTGALPGQGAAACLSTSGANAQVQHADRLATELVWEVRVQNRCAQSASGIVTFTVYGSRSLILESDTTKIVMAAHGVDTVQGILRLRREQVLQMRRYGAKISE